MSYFVPNPAGIAEVGVLPGMVGAMGDGADAMLEAARGYAPVDTGAYLASLQSDSGIDGATAAGTIFSDIDYAIYIEFGTSDTPVFQPIRRAVDGFHF